MDGGIDLVLLTGFLGAGKTTLLNSILTRKQDKRTGVLINEFGKVGVDGSLVKKTNEGGGLTVYEVADGSIFCTCKSASFVAGLRMFARLPEARRPERLIVEASGMSDPSGLTKLLRDNRLAGDYIVAGVVCLVDALRFPKVVHTLPAVRRQVEAADLLVINKVDRAEESAVLAIEEQISEINPQARVVRAAFGEVADSEVWTGRSKNLAGELVSCSTPETRPAAFQLNAGDAARPKVDRFLRDALGLTYRIKGWLEVDGRWYFISDNSGRIEWTAEDPPAGRSEGLTVICAPERAEEVAGLWRTSV